MAPVHLSARGPGRPSSLRVHRDGGSQAPGPPRALPGEDPRAANDGGDHPDAAAREDRAVHRAERDGDRQPRGERAEGELAPDEGLPPGIKRETA